MFLLTALLTICKISSAAGGGNTITEADTVISRPIVFTPELASEYITHIANINNIWRPGNDTLRLSLSRLIDHLNKPFDSIRSHLLKFPYDSVELKYNVFVSNDTLPARWLSNTEFIIDTIKLEKEPFITQKTIVMKALEVDTSSLPASMNTTHLQALIDSMFRVKDTITEVFVDYRFLEQQNVQLYRIDDGMVVPPLYLPGSGRSAKFIDDFARIVISDSSRVLMANEGTPFYIVPGSGVIDSLRMAVETLLTYTHVRDSILVFFHDLEGQKTPFWLTSGKDALYRYWIKNPANDSITIWIGNPEKHDISFLLEEDVSVQRKEMRTADDIPIPTRKPEKVLLKVQPLKEIPVFWNYGLSSAFSLNQNYLSNWSRGGQSSLSGMLDVKAEARYTDNETKTFWNNSGRLRYGAIRTKEQGYRTNTDIFELNSQYNSVLTSKLDFSTVFYMKTQVAKGYNYPNDSVVVSKFLNPGTFTIGVGVEYKPIKKTLINFSMLSYKNTFVLDTANIKQTIHGVEAGKRTRQELGGQLMIKNSLTILDGFAISNSLRLFTNYLHKPKNVDIDWEMSIERQINWFSSIRLNFHIIYDDDIRFPVFDQEGQPVILPDGSEKKVAKMQFNQFLGLSFSFRL